MALGSTQFLAEMNTRNLPGGKARLANKADNLTAICDPIFYKMRSLDVSQPYDSPCHVIGTVLLLPYTKYCRPNATEQLLLLKGTYCNTPSFYKLPLISLNNKLQKIFTNL
jgi:hypothetical protein